MTKKPARVPEMKRPHKWVVMGMFELELGEFDARRAVEHPEDFAVTWRDKAQLVGNVQGPGCSECGIHAKEGLGQSCEGPARLQRAAAEAGQPSRIWTPDQGT